MRRRDEATGFGDAGQCAFASARAFAGGQAQESHGPTGIVDTPRVADVAMIPATTVSAAPRKAWSGSMRGPSDQSGTSASICCSM